MTNGVAILLPEGLAGALGGLAIRAVVVAGAALIVDRMLRNRSAALRHLAWTLALAALVLLPIVRVSLPAVRVGVPIPGLAGHWLDRRGTGHVEAVTAVAVGPGVSGGPWGVAEGIAVDVADAEPTPPADAEPMPPTDISVATGTVEATAPLAWPLRPADLVVAGHSAETVPAGLAGDGEPYTRLSDLLVLVWLLGMGIVAVPVFSGLYQLARIGRTGPAITEDRILDWARVARRELGVRRPVRLIEGPVGAMPITWGIRRPVVLLPADASAWSDDRLLAVLRHEFAHVTRHDALTQLIGEIAVAFYWFNPLVWHAAARQRIERELACDDRVLACGPRASDYATALVDLARSSRAARTAALAGLAMARSSGLRDRLAALLDADRNRDRVSRSLAWRATAFSAIPVLLLGCVAPVPSESRAWIARERVAPVVPAAPGASPAPASQAIPAPAPRAPVPAHPHVVAAVPDVAAPAPLAVSAHPARVVVGWPASGIHRSRAVVADVRPPAPSAATAQGTSLTARLLKQARRHGIGDHQMGRLLAVAVKTGLADEVDREAWYDAAAGMSSDYEKQMAGTSLLADSPTDEDAFLAVRLSTTVRSDNSRASLLDAVLDAVPADGDLLDAVRHAAAGIRSKHERERVTSRIERVTSR